MLGNRADAERIFYRERLYSDFINENAHPVADAIQHNLQDPSKLTPTYALLSRMRSFWPMTLT
jgi:hypothetical protein